MLTLVALLLVPLQDKDAEELRVLWTKVVDLARTGKAEEMNKVISAWKISKEEFAKLFGEEKTAAAFGNYEKFWKSVDDGLADRIISQIKEKKYDTVDAWCLNTADAKDVSDPEKATIEALADKTVKLYSIRLRTKESKEGYRYSCFVKQGESWRAGLKVGVWLKPKK